MCITDEGLDFAKANSDLLLQKIKENPTDNSWLKDFFSKHKFINTKYSFDIEFKSDPNDPYKFDFDNAVKFYELMNSMGLGKAFIYNEKFLVSFALQNCYKYFATIDIKSLSGNLFFEGGKRRSIARNLIARLYMMVDMTIDSNSKDKYKYTKYLLHHSALRAVVFYRYLENGTASLSLIKSIHDFEKQENISVSVKKIRPILIHLSCLSNINDVSLMDEKEVYHYLTEYITQVFSAS